MKDLLRRFRVWCRERELTLALFLLVFLFLMAFIWPSILISIGPGERGAFWSRFTGVKVERIYPEGLHLIAPWDELTVYNVRYQVADRTYTVLSKDGVPIVVDLSVRYRPAEKLIARLHKHVGPDYLDIVVLPEVVTALRAVVAQYSVTEIHEASFAEMQVEVQNRARVEAAERWIVVDDVLFRGVTLPPTVTAAIERKIEQMQAAAEMKYRVARETLEADRKVIEARGVRDAHTIIDESLNPQILEYRGIQATLELAKSPNAKVVVVGGGEGGLPLILGPDGVAASRP